MPPAEPAARYLDLDPSRSPAPAPGLLELAPVRLPEDGEGAAGARHLGWPVATLAGDALLVLYHRTPAHWGGGGRAAEDAATSRAVLVRSADGGRSWTPPRALETLVEEPLAGGRLGFGNSLGTRRDGTVLAVTPAGVFTSADAGATWRHLPGAFGEAQLAGPVTNNGPAVVDHPELGLLVYGHETAGVDACGVPVVADRLWCRRSTDGGRTWTETSQPTEPFVRAVEPAACYHDGAVFLLARSHGSYREADRTWRYVQLVSPEPDAPFAAAPTAITAAETGRSPWHGPWSQDTAALDWNPTAQRFEAVVTNRNGGGAGAEHEGGMSLNLWSIGFGDLLAGRDAWRWEGTLLQRRGRMIDGLDGLHPGGAVVDAARGVQHLFLYAGVGAPERAPAGAAGLAGVFRLTRTLETDRLRRHLRPAE
jgi:hypothetical protein